MNTRNIITINSWLYLRYLELKARILSNRPACLMFILYLDRCIRYENLFIFSLYKRAVIIFILYLIRIAIHNRIVYKYYHYRYAITHVSIIIMRRHDSSPAFRHVRVSQIEIMLCGHYNRKYGAARYSVRYPHAVHLYFKRES